MARRPEHSAPPEIVSKMDNKINTVLHFNCFTVLQWRWGQEIFYKVSVRISNALRHVALLKSLSYV